MMEKMKKIVKNDQEKYSIFISHRRLTGQGIAGRVYQYFSPDHTVFLDTEANFNLKDLEKIISKSGLSFWVYENRIFCF